MKNPNHILVIDRWSKNELLALCSTARQFLGTYLASSRVYMRLVVHLDLEGCE